MNKILTTNTMAMVTLPNPSSLQLHKTFTFRNLTNPMNFKASKASSKTHICNFSNMVDIISQQSSMLNNKNNNTIINKTHILQLGVGLLAASMVIATPLDANATRLNYYATVADPPCELNYVRSGLGYCDLNVGSGVKAPRGELINVHYTARFADGTVFDSTYQRGRPLTMRIGVRKVLPLTATPNQIHATQVIQGLDEGILGDEEVPPMQIGGRRKLVIPPMLAYGPEPAGCFSGDCNIPGNATLVYDIKFVEIYSGNRK